MTKTIEMAVKVEVSEPAGVDVSDDMVRSLAAESVIKVRTVEWPLARRSYATVRASVQAFGEVDNIPICVKSGAERDGEG